MTLLDGLLGGRYRLHSQIAVGGMGEVWRADDTVLGRTVAVKTLKPEYIDDEEFRARFRAEARHAAGLVHPGIASVYDFGESSDRAWLVMELVEGEPLSTLLRREGTLSPDRTLDVVAQTAAALQVAHEGGLVHRDVKPGNLLVRPDGVVKVTDFGIASATDAVPLTRTGSVVGTAYYLSPEQAAGSDAVPVSDLYSLGVVAYECLTGTRPFPGDNPVAVAMAHLQSPPPPLPLSVPLPVRNLVLGMLSKDPLGRPPDAGTLSTQAVALRHALRGSGGAGAQDTAGLAALPIEPPPGTSPATRVLPAAAAGAAGGLAAGGTAAGVTAAGVTARLEPVRPALPLRGTGGREGAAMLPHRRAVRLAAVLLAVLALGLGLRAAFSTEQTTVPAIAAGTPEAQALAMLQEVGLDGRRATQASPAVPAGAVLDVTPVPGTEVAAGSEVTLVVSTGPAPVTVNASEVIGRPAGEVRDALTALGLTVRLVNDGTGGSVGTVSAVEPVGSLAVGTPVVLHVVPAPPPAVREPAGGDRGKDDDDEKKPGEKK